MRSFGHAVLDPGLEDSELVGRNRIFPVSTKLKDPEQTTFADGHADAIIFAIFRWSLVHCIGRFAAGMPRVQCFVKACQTRGGAIIQCFAHVTRGATLPQDRFYLMEGGDFSRRQSALFQSRCVMGLQLNAANQDCNCQGRETEEHTSTMLSNHALYCR